MELITKANGLGEFYANNSERFESRANSVKKYTNYVFLVACIVLIFVPGIIPFPGWIIRTAAIAGLIYFVFEVYIGGFEMYNKISKGKVSKLLVKKFDMSSCSESELVRSFENQDFNALIAAPSADDQPIQLYIDEDKVGKELYCILMKYYSSSDFRSVSDVIVLSGSDYDKWIGLFKSM